MTTIFNKHLLQHTVYCALIAVYCMLTAGSVYAQNQDTIQYKPVNVPEGFTKQIDVVYTTAGDWEGRVDFYLPPNKGSKTPIVINIHGGGWNKGVKESQTGFNTFFKAGYAVANIEYRLSQQATAPAAVEDTRCALLYIIKNADALNIDINKIVIMGSSAGGHLALMGGMLGNDRRFDKNCDKIKNVKVAAIIDRFGITDVWDWSYGKIKTSKSATQWLGEKAKDEKFAKSVSPLYYVNKNNPPIFIVHGDADPIVPYQQSVDLKMKLDSAGVKSVFMTVAGGDHGKFDNSKKKEVEAAIMAWLKELGI